MEIFFHHEKKSLKITLIASFHLTIQTFILQFRDIYKKQNCMTKGHNFEIKVAVTRFVFNSVVETKHCQIQTWNFKKERLRLKSHS